MKNMNHSRFSLAETQLKTAIMLFITNGDRLSVITLAGAADVILCELVKRKGKPTFTETLKKSDNEAVDVSLQHYGRDVNNLFSINKLKHFDEGDSEFITLDEEESALGAILKAIPNYIELAGREAYLVSVFLNWIRQNLDPKVYNIYCDPNWSPE